MAELFSFPPSDSWGAGHSGEHIGVSLAREERVSGLGRKAGPAVVDGTRASLCAAGPLVQPAACSSGQGVQEIAPKSYTCGLWLLRIYLLNILAISLSLLCIIKHELLDGVGYLQLCPSDDF